MIELNRKVQLLQEKITVPSEIHGYSLAVEYMRRWFLNKFNEYFMPIKEDGSRDEFFKTVYINGSHIFGDFRVFNKNKEQFLKREKPTLQITPTINIDNDRRGLKALQNITGPELFYKNNIDYGKYFFYDTENNIKIILSMDVLEVAFNFKLKVDTFAKQVDIFRFMNLYFRIGDTQSDYVDMDFNLPVHLVNQIARQAGYLKDNKIENPLEFLKYLNMHSKLPITYKLRTINGNPEYFVRVPDLYVHINNTDRLDRDDGERMGMLSNNYTIEMNSILTIPIPFLYCYITDRDQPIYIPTAESADLGLYSAKLYKLPERNKQGWETYMSTQIALDHDTLREGDSEITNFKELLEDTVVEIAEFCKSKYLSPSIFLDIQSFSLEHNLKMEIDWDTYDMKIYGPVNPYTNIVDIIIYIDQAYVNDYIANKEEIYKSRI